MVQQISAKRSEKRLVSFTLPSASSPTLLTMSTTALNVEYSFDPSLASNRLPDRQIDAVLFDFGGVLTSSPFTAIKAWAVENGHEPEGLLRMFIGHPHETDHPFHRAERGELSAHDMFTEISVEAAKVGIDPAGFAAGMSMTTRHDVIEYIKGLRADGIALALVTNNFAEMSGHWRTMAPVDDLFDLVVESSAEGVRKPTAAIYERALNRLGVAANRAAFLDDLEDNIAGSQAIGIHSIHVTDNYQTALSQLDALLGR
jgi:putative hydrolase of the HAD superfamily